MEELCTLLHLRLSGLAERGPTDELITALSRRRYQPSTEVLRGTRGSMATSGRRVSR